MPDFVLPLVPIAFAYLVAHYFSLFLIQGQFIFTLVSDPFGRGRDLFGTADFAPNLAIVSPETVWYVQVGALVVGHVAGLAIAHDRAVAALRSRRTRALRSQYPMLGADGPVHGRRPVAALAGLVAHGGIPGAIVESLSSWPSSRSWSPSGCASVVGSEAVRAVQGRRVGARTRRRGGRRRSATAGASAPTPSPASPLPSAATATPARMSALPSGRAAERRERDDDDGQRPERVAGDRENARGPELEHVLGLGNVRPRELGLERNRDARPRSRGPVDERERCRPAPPHQEQRAGAEQRRRQQRAAEVVDAERGLAPARGGTPRERARRHRIRGERGRPGSELRPALRAKAAHELAREPQGDTSAAANARRASTGRGLYSDAPRWYAPARATTCLAALVRRSSQRRRSCSHRSRRVAEAGLCGVRRGRILPPGENGSLTFDRNTTDQAKLYDGLTPLRGSVTPRDLRRFFKPAPLGLGSDKRQARERPAPA